MKLHDETNKPLWVERADLYHGSDLTPFELALEELDSSPHGWPVAPYSSSAAGQPPEFGDARLPERFWEQVRITIDGCWVWVGCFKTKGYGGFWDGKRDRRAHIAAYEALCGQVPEGLQLDHLCRVRCCVNPAHLEPVTPAENARRGRGLTASKQQAHGTHCSKGHPLEGDNLRVEKSGRRVCRECDNARRRLDPNQAGNWNARKTHCPRGHEYTEENTWVGSRGQRQCRTCMRLKSEERRQARKALEEALDVGERSPSERMPSHDRPGSASLRASAHDAPGVARLARPSSMAPGGNRLPVAGPAPDGDS